MSEDQQNKAAVLNRSALDYHRHPRPGKIEVVPSKPLSNQGDLALAYSPGVAAASEAIARDPGDAALYTARSNLVAVISNGTAVLGLGDIGPLAAKPVMEGKGVLFKKFAGIDVFDIEINEKDPDRLVEIIASLEPTFGGINLEDIKSPECFQIEGRLRQRMKIPVFHDDQHGTAIITAAAILNGLRLVGKRLEEVKLVVSGAGAAAIACVKLLVVMGMPAEHITLTDRQGVVYRGRKQQMDPHKKRFAQDTDARTLGDAVQGADIFLGLSGPGVLKPDMVRTMAERPIILALANPIPEILPEAALAARSDAIIATGRSDYPNQVNNVLCFPFIFRGALDVGATVINDEMKIACVHALAELTLQEASEVVVAAYGGEELRFGPEYLIPKPFDPRLIVNLAPAVAKAAMDSGVATRPMQDLEAYRQELTRYVFQSVLVMKPVFDRARSDAKRLIYAEGEEPRVLRAVQAVLDERLARPVLIGRPAVVEQRIRDLGLRITPGEDFDLVDPEDRERMRDYGSDYQGIAAPRGLGPEEALTVIRSQATALAALMVRRGEADALLCGVIGRFHDHRVYLAEILGLRTGVKTLAAMTALVLKHGTYFICDTHVNADPDAGTIAEMTVMAAEEVGRFGITPKVALLSHSNYGTSDLPSARKMREALDLIRERCPELAVDGEMQGDVALLESLRGERCPDSPLCGQPNLLIMPGLDAAHITMSLINALGEGTVIGPMLLGLGRPAHILRASASARAIVNMSSLVVVDAQIHSGDRLRETGAG